MPIPVKRTMITWGYFLTTTLILLLILGSVGDSGFLGFLVIANVVMTFWLVRIGHQLGKAFIPSVPCKQCGNQVDLVDRWTCSCGYTHATERHAFDRCPNCKGSVPFINCPKCDTSIVLSWNSGARG